MACTKKDLAGSGRLGWFWVAFAAVCLVVGVGVRVDGAYIDSDSGVVSETIASSWSRVSEDYLNVGRYLDRVWYLVLDERQYRYLDVWQYNAMGGLSYLLRHPAYPKLFERVAGGGVGFESGGHTGFFGFYDGFVIGNRVERALEAVPSRRLPTVFTSYNAGDYIDRLWYIYLDRGQYYYLDQTQYLLLGGLGYLYGRFSTDLLRGELGQELRCVLEKESKSQVPANVPEPATIVFLGFGFSFVGGFLRPGRA